MQYHDLRDFIRFLELKNELKRVSVSLSPLLEITEVCHRTLKKRGPALLFEHPTGYNIPVLGNLFGTQERVVLGLGIDNLSEVRKIGKILAFFRYPEAPQGFKDFCSKIPIYKRVLSYKPKIVKFAPCQEVYYIDDGVNLYEFPIQTCWTGDVGSLITWGLTITKGPNKERQNIGIYRQQVIGKNKLIMRWLPHRGGALDYLDWCKKFPHTPYPVVVALGTDPATILSAVIPIPDHISEYSFAGLLRGYKTSLVKTLTSDLEVPSNAEIILEGVINPGECADEGPHMDHTGYYNEVYKFPVFTIKCITSRKYPIYHSTYTCRPPDESSVIGSVLNEILIPILQTSFPEIQDFYLPPEGCSYRIAIVTIKKQYPGHVSRVMFGVWSFLRQFMYTKFIIVTDDDINARDWKDVIWAITTRMDPKRDTLIIDKTPIDYMDFASPFSGLGSKIGLDATNKLSGETNRKWGTILAENPILKKNIDSLWSSLGID